MHLPDAPGRVGGPGRVCHCYSKFGEASVYKRIEIWLLPDSGEY